MVNGNSHQTDINARKKKIRTHTKARGLSSSFARSESEESQEPERLNYQNVNRMLMRRYGDTSPPTHDRKTVPEQVLAIVRLQRVSMAAAWRTYLRESPSAVARNMGIPLATYKKLEKQQTLTLQEAKRVAFGIGITLEQLQFAPDPDKRPAGP